MVGLNVTMSLGGFEGIDRVLKQLPNAVSKKILVAASRKALQPVLKDARRDVPVRTGELKRSLKIGTKLIRSQRDPAGVGAVRVYVGASWPSGAHAHLIEFGTAHSGPRPFLRPAWDANKKKVSKEFGTLIWLEIVKTVRKNRERAYYGKLSGRQRRYLKSRGAIFTR